MRGICRGLTMKQRDCSSKRLPLPAISVADPKYSPLDFIQAIQRLYCVRNLPQNRLRKVM